jgi:hypothetical protein
VVVGAKTLLISCKDLSAVLLEAKDLYLNDWFICCMDPVFQLEWFGCILEIGNRVGNLGCLVKILL